MDNEFMKLRLAIVALCFGAFISGLLIGIGMGIYFVVLVGIK